MRLRRSIASTRTGLALISCAILFPGCESLSTTQLYTKVDAARLMDAFNAAHPRARAK